MELGLEFQMLPGKGALIVRIKKDGAADKAGYKVGDIITYVDDFSIKNFDAQRVKTLFASKSRLWVVRHVPEAGQNYMVSSGHIPTFVPIHDPLVIKPTANLTGVFVDTIYSHPNPDQYLECLNQWMEDWPEIKFSLQGEKRHQVQAIGLPTNWWQTAHKYEPPHAALDTFNDQKTRLGSKLRVRSFATLDGQDGGALRARFGKSLRWSRKGYLLLITMELEFASIDQLISEVPPILPAPTPVTHRGNWLRRAGQSIIHHVQPRTHVPTQWAKFEDGLSEVVLDTADDV